MPAVPVSFVLGSRYARGRKRNRFGAIVSGFSLFGMALGVAALIIVLSVMNGFKREIQERFQSVSPHLSFYADRGTDDREHQLLGKQLLSHPDVLSLSPGAATFAMLSGFRGQAPATIYGIEPSTDGDVVSLLTQLLYSDDYQLQTGSYGIILGSFLARELGVQPGDSLTLLLPKVRVTPAGIFPRQKKFEVVAVFDSGSQLDSEIAYVHIDDVQKLIGRGKGARGWRLKLNSADASLNITESVSEYSNWRAESWSIRYESLFRAMQTEKVTVGLLLLIIVIVAAFNIVSGLVMMVSDKRSDMAVLRTLGAETKTLMRVFVVQGLILGGSGIAIGALLGTLVALNLSSLVSYIEQLSGARVFDPNVFYVSFLPSEWRLSDFLWVVGSAFSLNLLATLVPAWQASTITPTEALNYKQ